MDPYCFFEMRQQIQKTKTCNNAGKTPNWGGEAVVFDIKYLGDDIKLTVFDEDIKKDDVIGSCEIKVAALCVHGGFDDWFKIFWKGKEVGTIHLKSIWEPFQIPAQQPIIQVNVAPQ